MSLFMISILLALVCFCSLVYLLQDQKTDRKLPPGPRALPIIGNLHLLGTLPHRALHNLSKKYGPIMLMQLGQVPTVVISSPEAAKLILKTHDIVFASRPKIEASQYFCYGGKGLAFTEYGPYWRNVRKLCMTHLFSPARIESFMPMRKELTSLMVESLRKAAMAREVVDVSAKIAKLVEEMACMMVFGEENDDRFIINQLIREGMDLLGAFNLTDYVPCLGVLDLQGLTKRMKANSRDVDVLIDKVIEVHEKTRTIPHTDFIDVLLSLEGQSMNTDEKSTYKVDRTNIKAIVSDIIAAAFDTSTVAIEWTLLELFKHPSIMKRVQQELQNVIGINQIVDEKNLSSLPYLDMVVKESFRLHPIGPFLIPRESTEDIVIDGHYIPKKSRVLVNTWAIGRDPKVWSDENVERFFPDRFVGNTIDIRGKDFELLPFGSGRRGCPGMNLGITTIKLVLAQLLHCFNWELPDGMLPEDLDLSEKFGLVLNPAKHLLARPMNRFPVKK